MDLPKIVNKSKKRRGKGYGSGKGGHTSGRGTKGQKSRGKIGILFEGVKVKKSLLRRLPISRGKGKFKAKDKPVVIKTGELNKLKSGSVLNVKTLSAAKLIEEKNIGKGGVKILAGGEKLEKKITLELPASKRAIEIIKQAGGSVK